MVHVADMSELVACQTRKLAIVTPSYGWNQEASHYNRYMLGFSLRFDLSTSCPGGVFCLP